MTTCLRQQMLDYIFLEAKQSNYIKINNTSLVLRAPLKTLTWMVRRFCLSLMMRTWGNNYYLTYFSCLEKFG